MQIANLVLKDNADVDVTFTPLQKSGLLITYGNLAKSQHNLREKVTLGLRPSRGSVPAKTTVRLTVPYEETLSDGSTIVRYSQFNIEATVNSDAPTLSIEDALSFAAGVIRNTQVEDTIKNEAFPY